jgi:hypothetical protein
LKSKEYKRKKCLDFWVAPSIESQGLTCRSGHYELYGNGMAMPELVNLSRAEPQLEKLANDTRRKLNSNPTLLGQLQFCEWEKLTI